MALKYLNCWLFKRDAPLLALGFPAQATDTLPQSAWRHKVDPGVLNATGGGPTEFLLMLDRQADLSGAAALTTKREKGRFVFEALARMAADTQGSILSLLKARGIAHQSFWDREHDLGARRSGAVQAMAARADVARIDANPTVRMAEPAVSLRHPGAAEGAQRDRSGTSPKSTRPRSGRGLHRPGRGGRRAGHRLPVGSPGAEGQVPRLGWHDGQTTTTTGTTRSTRHRGGILRRQFALPLRRLRPRHAHHGHHGRRRRRRGNQIGMAPGAKWIGCRNMDNGCGHAGHLQRMLPVVPRADRPIDGTDPIPARRPDVINNSWGCPPSEGCTDPNVCYRR